MLKLKDEFKPIDIKANDLKDGDIAVITQWRGERCIETIVQRYRKYLLILGKPSHHGWADVFYENGGGRLDDSCRVRLLQKGETLIVI